MPRPSNTAARRAQIIDAAIATIATRGYEGASIQRIAKQAALSPGLLHYHFPNKQAILLGVMEALAQRQLERFERRLKAAPQEGALAAYLYAHLSLEHDADPIALRCWVAISAAALTQPEVGQLYGDLLTRDLNQLEQFLAPQLEDTRQLKPVAATIFATIQGAYQLGTQAPQLLPTGFAHTHALLAAQALIQRANA